MKISNNYIYTKAPSFTSYNKLNPKTNLSVSTSFYHDTPTLQKAVSLIEENFPNGTDILVYAGSNGEEAISVDSMLKSPEKYNISSIDPFKEAIDYANRGYYSVHLMDNDGFLINPTLKDVTREQKKLRKNFYNNLEEIQKPKIDLNNMQDSIFKIQWPGIETEKFFCLRSQPRKRINFVQGDIKDIKTFPTKTQNGKVGAVFFRNALYHITKNDLTGILKYGDAPDMDINKAKILKDLVKNINDKLEIGGIFVLGNHTQEHFYIADKYTSQKNSVVLDAKRNIKLMTYPPHIKALFDIGTFEPVFKEEIKNIYGTASISLPLIWKKIK